MDLIEPLEAPPCLVVVYEVSGECVVERGL